PAVALRRRLRGNDGDLRRPQREVLVRPDWTGRPAFDGTGLTCRHAGQGRFRSRCVWLDSAVGAGSRTSTLFRLNTSKRGIGVENGCTSNIGLGGAPVGIDPYALLPKTLSPLVRTSVPAADMSPMRIKSRREI